MSMTPQEAIDARHSVRAYLDTPIPEEIRRELDAFVAHCNRASGLNISIVYDDPDGFDSRLAHYGRFRNVKNYIVLAGKKADDFDFACGYYGEKIVLCAQSLGLNTCWAALTFNKSHVKRLIKDGEALCMVIALGFGETQGSARRSKAFRDVTENIDAPPKWFADGVEAALKAPTAVNQQKFVFSMKDGEPTARVKGWGSYTRVDLGIACWHFEAVTGRRVRHEAL